MEDFGALCYMVDFLDYDGSLLDSRLCAYGEKIKDTVVPLRQEDARYIYRFAGWEPQFSETVSECAAYTAVYDRIEKSNNGAPGVVSGPDAQESPAALARGAAKDFSPEEIEQASSRSYDVTSFHIEASGEEPDIWERPENTPTVQPSRRPKEEAAGNWTVDSVNEILSEADAAHTAAKERQTFAPESTKPPAYTEAKESGKAENFPSALEPERAIVYVEAKESGETGNIPAESEEITVYMEEKKPEEPENAPAAPERSKEAEKDKEGSDAPERTKMSEKAERVPTETEPDPWEAGKKEKPAQSSKRKLFAPILLSAVFICCSGSVWMQKRKKGKVEK